MEGVQWSSVCQQNVEKHMPTYSHGTFIPEMSASKAFRMEFCTTGSRLRFHSDLAYTSSSLLRFFDDMVGKPEPWSMVWRSAPYSTMTSSSMLSRILQYSFSTRVVGMRCTGMLK